MPLLRRAPVCQDFFEGIVNGLFGLGQTAWGNHQQRSLQDEANKFNREEAALNRSFQADQVKSAMEFNSAEAVKNRDFQEMQTGTARDWAEKMANSTYQRAIGDLRAAGLNPMLAYSQGGAPMPSVSTPTGSQASGAPASSGTSTHPAVTLPRMNAMSQLLSTAQAAAGIDNIKADTKLKEASAIREASSAANLDKSTVRMEVELPKLRAEAALLETQHSTELFKQTVLRAQEALYRIERDLKEDNISLVKAETELTKARTLLANLAAPQARNMANAQSTWWMEKVAPFLPDFLKSATLFERFSR